MVTCLREAPLRGSRRMSEIALHDLARKAGIQIMWKDVSGVEKTVSNDSLVAILSAIGLPAETQSEISSSMKLLTEETQESTPQLLTADLGEPVKCRNLSGHYRIRLESGLSFEGELSDQSTLPGIYEPGYHQLEAAGREIELAVAPRSCFSLADVSQAKKMWGIAVQLYSLRGEQDGGIGDFKALSEFVRAAAIHGADAVAISPVHAQFSADLTRFGPYAPSNRAALNVLHIAEPTAFQGVDDLVDWPSSGSAKLVALRSAFASFVDNPAFDEFRRISGLGLERHAIFEAIQASLTERFGTTADWRSWPAALQNPESAEVLAFKIEHDTEIKFHSYLQYRADLELSAVQSAARTSGMKIGLIADLAVGTDQGGSHSWSRQNEILRGLEVGAPPDAINRQGQSWGITAFSPRGLRKSGFSGFIEMLRHALRHAGGVRIDHVMGLARLWLIPHGSSSAEGAYLNMPVRDLMRLVRLESYRHKAVIIGEDLGTLPEGFQATLDEAGIAGLRVLWFEKDGTKFRPPAYWSKAAVAVTSTHDLPTVAGWWRGQDISWRDKLGLAGDDMDTRDQERKELWTAMVTAGSATMPMPAHDDAGPVADAACTFLGQTASTLALLPIEDALALPEQPNLPGTTNEHPNWRRRMRHQATDILNQPDVAARLGKLNSARSL